MAQVQPAGATAAANEEAVRAWDTVLYERWKKNREVFVGALEEITEKTFDRCPPPEGGRCIDIGCGFGETTQRLAELVGPGGFALGIDSSPSSSRMLAARRQTAGVDNIEFEVADAQTAQWEPCHDYAFSRMGTQFFAAPGSGDARDPRRAQARRPARQDLLATQGREPDLGGDRAGR